MRAIVLVLAVLLSGCATQPLPEFNYNKSGVFLYMNLVEEQATHTYLGFTVFQNHSKRYSVDWDIPGRMDAKLSAGLGERLRPVPAPAWLTEAEGGIVSAGWDSFALAEEYKPKVTALCNEHNAAGIIIVRSYGGTRWILGGDRYLKGYGIYSQRALGNNPALVYTNFGAQVMNCDPPAFTIGSGAGELPKIADYVEPEDSTQLPASEWAKARPFVEAAADKVINNLVDKLNARTQ